MGDLPAKRTNLTKCWFIHKENIENAFKIARNIEPNINQNSIGKDN